MSTHSIKELYQKVDHLIQHCEQLKHNNEQLQSREQQWLEEKTRLVEKNEMARKRVEAMIGHLKTLQQAAN